MISYLTLPDHEAIEKYLKDALPFRHTIYGDLYLLGKYEISDVILLILNKIEIVNLLLGNTKIKH